ncbi:MAG: chorismate mutase [Chloroflexota bacterium]|nr:chorismate mutase [Chloroflexota bacterium]
MTNDPTLPPPAPVRCRGVRGAIFVPEDTPDAIWEATRELLGALAASNGIDTADITSVFFTTTPDLRSAFPARAARQLGWVDVPLLGATEMDHVDAPGRCIRVLLHWNTTVAQSDIVHVYLRGADVMRAGDPPSHLSATPPALDVHG